MADQEGHAKEKRMADQEGSAKVITGTEEISSKERVSHEHDEEDHMFSVREENQEASEEDVWLIDSGCTNHMTPNEKRFVNINTSINVPIGVGNGAVLVSKGKGDIKVMTKKGVKIS